MRQTILETGISVIVSDEALYGIDSCIQVIFLLIERLFEEGEDMAVVDRGGGACYKNV